MIQQLRTVTAPAGTGNGKSITYRWAVVILFAGLCFVLGSNPQKNLLQFFRVVLIEVEGSAEYARLVPTIGMRWTQAIIA